MNYGFKDSMDPANSYVFNCPVVGRDARFVVCGFKLRKHRRGEDFAEQDCRCAMRASKCPIMHMMRKEWEDSERHFFSVEPKTHRLPAFIFERIERLIILPFHGRDLNLTPEQQRILFDGSFRSNHAESQDKAASPTKPTRQREPRASAVNTRVEDDMLAAMTSAAPTTAEVLNRALDADGTGGK